MNIRPLDEVALGTPKHMSLLQQISSFVFQLTRINWIGVAQYLKLNPTRTLTSALIAVLVAIHIYQSRRRLRTPRLRGPRSQTFLSSIIKNLFPSLDWGVTYQDREWTYEPAYEIPSSWGSRHFVLNDPTAIAHIFSKDTTTYHKPYMARAVSRPLVSVCLARMFPALLMLFPPSLVT
jgi:hypothetical protein